MSDRSLFAGREPMRTITDTVSAIRGGLGPPLGISRVAGENFYGRFPLSPRATRLIFVHHIRTAFTILLPPAAGTECTQARLPMMLMYPNSSQR